MAFKWAVVVVGCVAPALSGCGSEANKPAAQAPTVAAEAPAEVTKAKIPASPDTHPVLRPSDLPVANSPAGNVSTPASPGGKPPFVEVSEQIKFEQPPELWPEGVYLTPEITPGGVLVFDYDGDGLLDLYQVCHSPPAPMPNSFKLPAPNRLFKNLGALRFAEVKDAAGLADLGYGHGGCVGDIDNDGDLDVFVTNYGKSRLFRNDGGKFTDITDAAGVQVDAWSSAASFFDYDRDGYLDLVVVNFAQFDPARRCQSSLDPADGDYCGPHTFPGVDDQLFRNRGDGTFTEVSKGSGLDVPARGWGVVCFDANDDSWPDLLVANDEEPNQLFINQKNGKFVDEAVFYGVALSGAGKQQANMGIAIGDLDRDGRFDLFITHVASETNVLYTSGGSPPGPEVQYTDSSHASGMAAVDLPYTGWGCGFFDYDHDGLLDVAVANGRVAKSQVFPGAKLSPYWNRYAEPNLLFHNAGNGKMTDVSAASGDFCKHVEVTRALAFADLDNDGDLDLVSSTVGNTLRVFRNDAPAPGSHWLMVRALSGKRDAYGALLTLVTGNERRVALLQPSYSYLASNDPRVHFGLGAIDRIDRLEVAWPDGSKETFPVSQVNQVLTVKQGEGKNLP